MICSLNYLRREGILNMCEILTKEVFIPLKIDTRVGRRPNIIKPDDYFARTHLMKLLARARILEDQLTNSTRISYAQFCLQHKISQRYLRSLISLNNLSPKIKKAIVEGYVPKHLSIQDITNCRVSPIWSEQEVWFFIQSYITNTS
jgi:hypothetical protein